MQTLRTAWHRVTAPRFRLALIAITVVLIGGYILYARGEDRGATLVVASADFSEQVSVSGTVTAATSVDLGFAANGRISLVTGVVGGRVRQGTVLAQIENGDLAAELSRKLAAREGAEALLASLKAGTRQEEVSVAAAAVMSAQAALIESMKEAYTDSDDAIHNKADTLFTNARTNPKLTFNTSNAILKSSVEASRAALESSFGEWAALVAGLTQANVGTKAQEAQSYLARVRSLLADLNAAVNQGIADASTSSATLTSHGTTIASARSSVNTATTELTSDQNDLASAEKNMALKKAGSTEEKIREQEAAVTAAMAEVASARAALAKTLVVAPFTGTITRMDAKIGEIVSPSTSLISMQSDSVFQIETFVPEVSIARIAPGNSATTTLDAYGSSVAFASKVVAVDPAETMRDGVPTYKTTLAFLEKDARIRSGMTANVIIETGVLRNAIVIPAGAVSSRDGAFYVSVVAGDVVEQRPVTVGPSPALGQAFIRSGLNSGETILLKPVR